MFFQGDLTFNDEIYITNVRQKTALQDAYDALQRVNDSIDANMPEDFYSIDLMDAYEVTWKHHRRDDRRRFSQ